MYHMKCETTTRSKLNFLMATWCKKVRKKDDRVGSRVHVTLIAVRQIDRVRSFISGVHSLWSPFLKGPNRRDAIINDKKMTTCHSADHPLQAMTALLWECCHLLLWSRDVLFTIVSVWSNSHFNFSSLFLPQLPNASSNYQCAGYVVSCNYLRPIPQPVFSKTPSN